ncbi:MAG: translation elongation factor 4 [Candidatus Paceibacterota bacterium]
MEKDLSKIRNFVIIAHIDHGKSTLADRFLEITGTIKEKRKLAQYLDRMTLEKEHGVTIKMHPVRMIYQGYILNLIDTPGHIDFNYEVSRALLAAEGAILLVDVSQGIQAQTLHNFYLAQKENLYIIGALNKIDLPIEDLEEKRRQLAKLLGVSLEKISLVSAKTGEGVKELLERVIKEIPAPQEEKKTPFKALIFDSHYDPYKGVIAYVRVFEGQLKKGQKIEFFAKKIKTEVLDIGYFSPELISSEDLRAGEIGWIATGLKDPSLVRVGDTIFLADSPLKEALPGYQEPKPMIFASFYLKDSTQKFEDFRNILNQLKLNDWSLFFEPEKSEIFGRGFRIGFLGMFHLKIILERLEKEYQLKLLITPPTVPYKIYLKDKKDPLTVSNPIYWPEKENILKIEEPIAKIEVITPVNYLSSILKLIIAFRGKNIVSENFSGELMKITAFCPLSKIIKNFYDKLKSISSGYASFNYEFFSYEEANLEKLEVLLASKKIESLSKIVYSNEKEKEAKNLALNLKNIIPQQLYPVPIQVKDSKRIIARETIPALKKDVTGHLYGGDRTRKMKLWKKQKEGKKRLLEKADLKLDPEIFYKIYSLD